LREFFVKNRCRFLRNLIVYCASFSVSTTTYHRRERKSNIFSIINLKFSSGVFLTTAMQIMSVERRRLTIVLMYGIITAEKEFMRSRIFDFLIASISHRNGLDYIFDHLRLWTTWKQCRQEHQKASYLDSKAPKSLVNQAKNRYRFVRDHEARSRTSALRPPMTKLNTRDCDVGLVIFVFIIKFIASVEKLALAFSVKFNVFLNTHATFLLPCS